MRSLFATALAGSPAAANRSWLFASTIIALLAVAPIVALVLIATQSSGDLWPHLISYVLPHALTQTALMLAGVSAIPIATSLVVSVFVARMQAEQHERDAAERAELVARLERIEQALADGRSRP